jgi:hypothetical protein
MYVNMYLMTGAPILVPATLVNASAEYKDSNTQAILTITDFCTPWIDISADVNGDVCPPFTFLYLIDETANPIFLTMTEDAFIDFSVVPNANVEIATNNIKEEGAPECFGCLTGEYVSTNCTTSTDAVCSTCDTCPVGQFAFSDCQDYQNILCQGMYVSMYTL